MAGTQKAPKHFAVMAYTGIPGAMTEVQTVANFLLENGAEDAAWGTFQDSEMIHRVHSGEFDILIALGGDGTMLRAGSLGAPTGLPLLGINLGHFGFLTEIQQGEWRTMLPRLLAGDYRLEERMMLRAEHMRGQKSLGTWHVINEVVVCRGQFVRPIQIEVHVDGYLMTRYVADGLLASTPTGSTAYALATGGPILPPDLRNILIVPVAPHLSMNRAMVLAEGSGVKMTVHTSHEAVMSVDGHLPIPMLEDDSVLVTANDRSIQFVRFQDPGYFYRNITTYMEQSPLTGNR